MADVNSKDLDALRERIQQRYAQMPLNIQKALVTIGADLSRGIIQKIQSNHQISNGPSAGTLLNSIKAVPLNLGDGVFGLEVGSYGTKYAATNEFGAIFQGDQLRRMRAHWFAKLNEAQQKVASGQRKTIGKKFSAGGKGRFSLTTGIFESTPFMRPAFKTALPGIRETLRKYALEQK